MKTWSDLGIEINSNGGQIRTTCPHCSPNRKKSTDKCLAVDTDKQVYFCHHCGRSGGLNGETKAKVREYIKPEYKKSSLPSNVIEYFQKRGISEAILSKNNIGYGQSFKDKKGIQFPYYKGGQVVNIKHRAHDKTFRQEKDAEKGLYRFDSVAGGTGTLILTEGEIDCLSFQEAGFEYVSSIPDGAPSAESKNYNTKFDFLKSAESLLNRYDKIILAMDDDPPGKTAERELARRIGIEKCYRVQYPEGCKDANDVLVKYGKAAVTDIVNTAKPYPIEGLLQVIDFQEDVLSLYDKGVNRGIYTGWKQLDPHYTVKLGELTVITGIPGSGKSNFIDSLMINLVEGGDWRFAVFSPENWPIERHIQTLLEKLVRLPFAQKGRNTDRMPKKEIYDHLPIMNHNFFFIMPKDELLSVDTILEKARAAIFRYGIKGLVIDPWNEVEHLFGNLSETQYISKELTKIRRFARMNQIHVWIVAHPRNLTKDADGNYKPPTMYEISGGANWRNKADNGLCVHRPDHSSDDTEIYIQKIRFKEVGRIGKATLKYCRDTGTYS
jgi:twinkle protein